MSKRGLWKGGRGFGGARQRNKILTLWGVSGKKKKGEKKGQWAVQYYRKNEDRAQSRERTQLVGEVGGMMHVSRCKIKGPKKGGGKDASRGR